MMVVGFSTAMLWRTAGLNQHVYEGAPGIAAALLVFLIASWGDSLRSDRN